MLIYFYTRQVNILWLIIARVTSILESRMKGGRMKRSIQECEDMDDYAAAMADAWREEQRLQSILETLAKAK